MRHEVRLSARAQRTLECLPLGTATALAEFVLGRLAAQPRRAGVPVRTPGGTCWRARCGDVRVRYLVQAGQVLVVSVDHRRDRGALRLAVGPGAPAGRAVRRAA